MSVSTLTLTEAVSDYLIADFDGLTDAESLEPLREAYAFLKRDHRELGFTFEQFQETFFAVRRAEGIAPVG